MRKPERFQKMLDACRADLRGRKGFADQAYPQADFLARLASQAATARHHQMQQQRDLSGKAMGEAIREARLDLIEAGESASATATGASDLLDESQ